MRRNNSNSRGEKNPVKSIYCPPFIEVTIPFISSRRHLAGMYGP